MSGLFASFLSAQKLKLTALEAADRGVTDSKAAISAKHLVAVPNPQLPLRCVGVEMQ
jgi:hypothetical protein